MRILGLVGLVLLAGCSDHGVGVFGGQGARGIATLTSSEDDSETSTPILGDDDDDDDDDDGCSDDDSSDDDTGNGDTGDDDSDDSSCDDDDDSDDEESDLPYAVELDLGETFVLTDAFAEKGPLPAAILSVTMEAPEWRLLEISGLVPFTVDPADCDHEGNRDIGRDRIEVTWQNADGSVETDHLDLRYCGA